MRLLLAFTITLLIYSLLFWVYIHSFNKIKIHIEHQKDDIIKINIHNIPMVKKEKKVEKTIKKKIKKRLNKKIAKKIESKPKKIKKAPKSKKRVVKKNIKQKKRDSKRVKIKESDIVYIPNPIIKKEIQFSNNIEPLIEKSYPNPKVKKLYGKEFHSYTDKQKRFIEDKLDEIHRITQNTLWQRGYPGGVTSAKTGQEGINIVSFYLHPNGDISELRLKKRVGYRILDENTIETIKSAYKDYPYPEEKTKIIFFVEYSIFGY